MRRRVAALLGVGVIALSAAPGAIAAGGGNVLGGSTGGSPISPGLPAPTVSTPTATAPSIIPTTTTAGDSGLSGGTAVGIGVGALVVLAAISLFIWRDARRRAPVRSHRADDRGRPGSKRPPVKQRKLSPAERRRRKRGRAR